MVADALRESVSFRERKSGSNRYILHLTVPMVRILDQNLSIERSNDMCGTAIQKMGVVAAAKKKFAVLTSTYDDILLQPPQLRKRRSEFSMCPFIQVF